MYLRNIGAWKFILHVSQCKLQTSSQIMGDILMAYINGKEILLSAQLTGLVNIDTEMSETSENPVQNTAVKAYADGLAKYRIISDVTITEDIDTYTISQDKMCIRDSSIPVEILVQAEELAVIIAEVMRLRQSDALKVGGVIRPVGDVQSLDIFSSRWADTTKYLPFSNPRFSKIDEAFI